MSLVTRYISGRPRRICQVALCRSSNNSIHSRAMSAAFLKKGRFELLVCDMAGTTVNEGGAVYLALLNCMNKYGLHVTEKDINPFHGIKKEDVISHFIKVRGKGDATSINAAFEEELLGVYCSTDSKVSLIHPELPLFFEKLRSNGIKVGLNTGYPPKVQSVLLKRLELEGMIDCYTNAYSVQDGRPHPYMIQKLMADAGVTDPSKVAKVGDSLADVGEGRNANCGLVVGVLSGADTREELQAAGPDLIVDKVVDIPTDF